MLQVGQKAPTFSLPDSNMEMMDLASFRGKKNVVLFFYPKDGTPACTMQAIGFSDREEEFDRLDTVVFGISRDDVLSHEAFRDEHGLSVQLLADTESDVCRLYHVLEENRLRRSTFLIDKQGVLRSILHDVSPREHVDEVLEACRELLQPASARPARAARHAN